MILTQIFVVMCTLTGGHCVNYTDVVTGVLSASACEGAIQQVVHENATADLRLLRERSFCSQMPVNSQNDVDS
jgi:hypothetical protein